MTSFRADRRRSKVPKRIWWLVIALVVLMIAGAASARQIYYQDLKPASSDQTTKVFMVEKGDSVKQIAAGLENRQLIRSAWAFQLYVHSKELGSKLQAGTYAFSPSES